MARGVLSYYVRIVLTGRIYALIAISTRPAGRMPPNNMALATASLSRSTTGLDVTLPPDAIAPVRAFLDKIASSARWWPDRLPSTGLRQFEARQRTALSLRRSRYMGRAKAHLRHLATAAAINLERVADWFAGVDREKTRTSAFARVMTPLAVPS
jgi:hypothetical protein